MLDFENLAKIKKDRNLVSIRRAEIDDARLQAFLIDYSETLVLVHYVYDFNLDGLMLLRCADISCIQSDKTDLFQTQMLKEEGLYEQVDFDISCDLSSWSLALSTLGALNRIITIDDENPKAPVFYIGKVIDIGTESVSIKGFSGAGNWNRHTSGIHYDYISCIQMGNHYSSAYERYFARNA